MRHYKHRCPVMKAFTAAGSVTGIKCGMWACPNCSKLNARLWAWRVKIQLNEDPREAYFWTLTMRGGYKNARDGYVALPVLWDALRKYMQRKLVVWTYCAFVESQAGRGGMPHFHIITLARSPYRLKDLAFHYGFGYQAKEIEINGPKAAQYVSKYASKGDTAMPRGFRRVRASRDWAELPVRDSRPYIVPAAGESLVDFLLRVSEETNQAPDEVKDKWITFDMRVIEF